MVQIDIPMPQKCVECPSFSSAVYGRCLEKDIWFGVEDHKMINITVPNWCPMKEKTKPSQQ